MPAGKTIQIYCPSGEPRGLRIAEITTGIVQAVGVPRAKVDEGLKREELEGVGLYLLFGDAEGSGRPLVYIGQSGDCSERLRQHHRNTDFWSSAVVIVSRTASFTAAHGSMLEWLAIDKASKAGRYELQNGNAAGQPNMPEWMQSDVATIFETADVLLGTLGFPVFEPAASSERRDADHLFMCTRAGLPVQDRFGGLADHSRGGPMGVRSTRVVNGDRRKPRFHGLQRGTNTPVPSIGVAG